MIRLEIDVVIQRFVVQHLRLLYRSGCDSQVTVPCFVWDTLITHKLA